MSGREILRHTRRLTATAPHIHAIIAPPGTSYQCTTLKSRRATGRSGVSIRGRVAVPRAIPEGSTRARETSAGAPRDFSRRVRIRSAPTPQNPPRGSSSLATIVARKGEFIRIKYMKEACKARGRVKKRESIFFET